MDAPDLQELQDRAAIHDMLMRYPRADDSHNFELMKTVFTEDGTLTTWNKPIEGSDEIVRRVSGLTRYKATSHFMGNESIKIDGDSATTEVYAVAYHFHDVDGKQQAYLMWIRYHDVLVRTNEGWRIKERVLQTDTTDGPPLDLSAASS